MTQVTHRELLPGVRLTAVQTNKFKSNLLSITLMAPLDAKTASANALLPYVLRRGTREHPDMESLSAALDELYGGSIEPAVRKKGEAQGVGFVGSFLDDAYALDDAHILEQAASLMGEVLLCPATEKGGFKKEYVEGERSNLVDRIQAQVNEKRSYSLLRLTQEMCAGEPYGVDRLGDEKSAAAITAEGLCERYQALLAHAPVELYYCGSADADRVAAALTAALDGLPRAGELEEPDHSVQDNATQDQPRLVTESLDVTQGKLALGFRTGGACVWEEDYPALLVFNALYGGTPTSKLFLNVREKLSLCYFASSMLEKFKGVMVVSSGIEFRNYEKAKAEILAQLDNCRTGAFEDWELEGARRAVVSALRATMDAQGRLEDYWMGQAVAGLEEPPQDLVNRVEAVTREQVVAVAGKMELDTIYFLKGKED